MARSLEYDARQLGGDPRQSEQRLATDTTQAPWIRLAFQEGSKMSLPPFEWEIVDDIMVTRNRPGDVDDGLWSSYIDQLTLAKVKGTFSMVDGSITITATQRKAAADTLTKKKIPAVVVIDNRFSRGILTAISWLGGNVQAFPWKDVAKAVEAVETEQLTRDKLLRLANDFAREND
ncbi:MAG: hypothetical protein AB1Z98_28115 [Nannocystaceae bacterium]